MKLFEYLNFEGQYMKRSACFEVMHMKGPYFSAPKYMNGLGFEEIHKYICTSKISNYIPPSPLPQSPIRRV